MEKSRLKIIVLGSVATGKTSLIKKFTEAKLSKSYKITVGVDILIKEVEYENGKIAELSIWDVGGQKRFDYVRDKFYEGTDGAIIVFDLMKKKTYQDVKKWLADLTKFGGNDIPFVLLGNTINISKIKKETINRDEVRVFAEKEGGLYIEASTKNYDNVEKVFLELIHQIYKPS